MEKIIKVEVCANCSGFDVSELKGKVKAKVGCIGKCSRKNPGLSDKVYGFLNGEFAVCDTKEAFFEKIDHLGAYTPISKKNPLVDAFLETVGKWKAEHIALRELALDCGLTEDLKWGQPCYTIDGGNVAIIGGFKEYIALSFFKGALLRDIDNLLIRQTENVQAGRQLRFVCVGEIEKQEAVIKSYILEAIEIEKAGLKVPEAPKAEMELPAELLAIFEENASFKDAFYALTPGRQRGYIFHFSQPKQSQTRTSRIEKSMQRIFDGLGIND